MKKVSLSLFTAGIIALAGCTSDINSDIPVSSNDLIDQNVVYKSETVKVDVEAVKIPSNDFSKNNVDQPKVVAVEEKKVEVIIPPKATNDETVDFVDASYIEKKPEDIAFETAVFEAASRRGVKFPEQRKVVPAKRLNTTEVAGKVQPSAEKTTLQNHKLNIEIPVENKGGNITFLSTIVYHSNTKADISPRDMKALKNVAKLALKKNATVRVVGNASSRSKDMKEIQNKIENFDLSLVRAQKVCDALIGFGIPKDKVFISAVADTEKVVEENMPINEAINRRTEIYLNY